MPECRNSMNFQGVTRFDLFLVYKPAKLIENMVFSIVIDSDVHIFTQTKKMTIDSN
jgi:hypothetical protein